MRISDWSSDVCSSDLARAQRDRETGRLIADPAERARRVVVRKGRENYLCLLNLEEALQGGFQGRALILAHLAARWAAYSRDGDMVGGDMPGWLPSLFRRHGSNALTDRDRKSVGTGKSVSVRVNHGVCLAL